MQSVLSRWMVLGLLRLLSKPALAAVVLTVPLADSACAQEPAAGITRPRVEFNRDIRPILADKCFSCHGPDRNARKAELRLDVPQPEAAEDSSSILLPGHPQESLLYQRILETDPELVMPPPATRKTVSAEERELLRRWIEQGAEYQGHWSFLPVQAPTGLAGSLSNQIDQLVQRQLKVHELQPSPTADPRTLMRRLSFDLTGLPPESSEVESFAADPSDEAFEQAVDRMLASPHHGERMATWWLDLVRYADTVGYHGDQEMSVSPYRQYVIEAFQANKPFDEFTIEQLAGDLLPDAGQWEKVASGYNRLGMMSAEGGVQDKEYLARYIAERVRNASGTWLGLTLGCAECHDHKFDPLTTRDFYRFEAFFADIRERGLYSGANSDGNWGPSIRVPSPAQAAELKSLDAQIADVRQVLETSTPSLNAAQLDWENRQVKWHTPVPSEWSTESGTVLSLQSDASLLASGTTPDTDSYVLRFPNVPAGTTAIRLEALADDSLPAKGPGRAGNGNFVLTELTARIVGADGSETVVPFRSAAATYEQTGAASGNPWGKWAVAAAIDSDAKGRTWGWAVMEQVGQSHAAVFVLSDPVMLQAGQTLSLTLAQNLNNPRHTLGRFRLSFTTDPPPAEAATMPPADIAAILEIPRGERTEDQRNRAAQWFRTIAPELQAVRDKLQSLSNARSQLQSAIPTSLITEAVEPRMVRILPRGNWMDDSGEIVTPAFPESLAETSLPDRRLTRLDLARWIVAPDNPLTARVVVNRLWKICFGAGLSRKLDDLGSQGEWPTHPELLDLLATRLIESGWDIRHILRSIVLSQTWRQSSRSDDHLREIDPENRWLARQGRFRLDAEFVRDNALAVSGLLVRTVGGRSVHPYQPAGYWAYLNFPVREWRNGTGADLYRRGLYTHWQRQYLHPALLAFDAPSREECTADRPRSNTPLQALVLLNDPEFVEAARVFAERILREGGDSDSSRLDFAFRTAVSRPILPEEQSILESLLAAHLTQYLSEPAKAEELLKVGAHPVTTEFPPAVLAGWTSVARTILNLHECITRN